MLRSILLCSAFCFLLSAFFPAQALTYEVVRQDSCRAVGYSSEKRQTDHDPFSTASGTRPKWGTVAANHLPLWTRMKIEGFGEKVFVVEDRMNKRYKKMLDLWFPSLKEARAFGCRRVNYTIIRNVRPLPD